MYDVIIIGAGIVGSFLAHDLSKFKLNVAVIDKESDVANCASMANSAIIHAGHDPKEGTLKAKLNVRGNRIYPKICKELGVDFLNTSAYVTAVSEAEAVVLDGIYQQAEARGIPVSYLTLDEATKEEPNLSNNIYKVIELPTTGVISPWETAIALMEEAVLNNVDLFLNERVKNIKLLNNENDGNPAETTGQKEEDNTPCFIVETEKNKYITKWIINAAGAYADEIYGMVSEQVSFHIHPRKGEYFVIDRLEQPFVNHVIYPVPSEKGKGVLAVPTTHGNLLIGPNSDYVTGKEAINNTMDSLQYVKKEISKTLDQVPFHQVIRNFAGIRPTGNQGDFIIEEASDVPRFVNAACIESPGLASAPAISEYIIEKILSHKMHLNHKENYVRRKPLIHLNSLSQKERNELVLKNPAYGRIICRCEQITEGEILDAIHRPVGAVTVKGVKKRVRPGMGRCQGGFCEPLVLEILARELSVSPLDVRLDSNESIMLTGMTKEGQS